MHFFRSISVRPPPPPLPPGHLPFHILSSFTSFFFPYTISETSAPKAVVHTTCRHHLLDFQDVRAKGHVVESGDDLAQSRENEESSDRKRDSVGRSVLEVRRVVRP